MRRYETIYIARPDTGEDEISAISDRAAKTITSNDGAIVKIDNWGLKKLAYPIKKKEQGYYVYLEYAGVPEAVAEIERVFRIDDKIIKYMTIKTQDIYIQDAEPPQQEATEETESEVTETAKSPEADEVDEAPEETAESAE